MRGPCSFRKRDVTRAIQAVIAAGIEGRVEIEPHGKIVIVIGKSAAQNFVVPIAANDNTWNEPRKLPPTMATRTEEALLRKGKGAAASWSRKGRSE